MCRIAWLSPTESESFLRPRTLVADPEVFAISKQPSCPGSVLAPCHTLMADEYQHGGLGEPFSFKALVACGQQPLENRTHAAYWDGDFA